MVIGFQSLMLITVLTLSGIVHAEDIYRGKTARVIVGAKTLTDPEFVAEAKKVNLDINPLTGEEVKTLVDGLFELPTPTLTKPTNMLAAT